MCNKDVMLISFGYFLGCFRVGLFDIRDANTRSASIGVTFASNIYIKKLILGLLALEMLALRMLV